jgi:hypothetical protein
MAYSRVCVFSSFFIVFIFSFFEQKCRVCEGKGEQTLKLSSGGGKGGSKASSSVSTEQNITKYPPPPKTLPFTAPPRE